MYLQIYSTILYRYLYADLIQLVRMRAAYSAVCMILWR